MLRITEDKITTHPGPASAELVSPAGLHQEWAVCWLPDGRYSRNQAISAMTLAEQVLTSLVEGQELTTKQHIHIGGWAHELGLEGEQAIRLVLEECGGIDLDAEPPAAPRPQWETMRPRDFGTETHTQTAMLVQTDPGTLF